MASLRDIRKRIRSVKNTEKITKAMKMVAAAKLRRAQEEVRRSRAYSQHLDSMVSKVARRTHLDGGLLNPLLKHPEQEKRVEVLVLTSDRGLCGAFNSSIIKKATLLLGELKQTDKHFRVSTLGKKGFDVFRRSFDIRTNYEGVLERPTIMSAKTIASEVCDSFIKDEIDTVYLVYNEFRSAISQQVIVKQLLPIVASTELSEDSVDYIYEPAQEELLSQLLERHFATQLYQAFLESVASEYGARMTAMDNATRNAKEMIGSLTLQYNRARQAAITKELMEIIGGAEALA